MSYLHNKTIILISTVKNQMARSQLMLHLKPVPTHTLKPRLVKGLPVNRNFLRVINWFDEKKSRDKASMSLESVWQVSKSLSTIFSTKTVAPCRNLKKPKKAHKKWAVLNCQYSKALKYCTFPSDPDFVYKWILFTNEFCL